MPKLAMLVVALALAWLLGPAARGAVEIYGTENVLGTGTYSSDPTAGATLQSLAPGVSTQATLITPHDYPFTPAAGDFPGTDQIYVGSSQTGADDGYSSSSERISGPDVMTMDYSSLVGGGTIQTLTLGIAADDFQFPDFGNPFIITVNGHSDAALTTLLESLNQSGPVVQFVTIGIDPSILTPDHKLVLSIDEGGDGGDGYAVDFLSVGVTTRAAVPEPASVALMGAGGLALLIAARRRQSRVNAA